MSYDYQTQKPEIFRPENQELFLKIRDRTHRLLKEAGAVRLEEAAFIGAGDSWTMMACMDRLVELKEIVELVRDCPGQHRVFVAR